MQYNPILGEIKDLIDAAIVLQNPSQYHKFLSRENYTANYQESIERYLLQQGGRSVQIGPYLSFFFCISQQRAASFLTWLVAIKGITRFSNISEFTQWFPKIPESVFRSCLLSYFSSDGKRKDCFPDDPQMMAEVIASLTLHLGLKQSSPWHASRLPRL